MAQPKWGKKQREALIKLLKKLITDPKTPLVSSDPYTLLIATLLSAQCTDERVNKVTPILFSKAKTPSEMMKLPISTIEKCIHSLGLYKTKAKNIWHLSKILHEQYHDRVPCDMKVLESLPGVGHKTASIVMVQAFKKPAFPVDTHIFRCSKRWGLSSKKTIQGVEKDLKELFLKKSWGEAHLLILLAGKRFCTARAHTKESCPICSKILNR